MAYYRKLVGRRCYLSPVDPDDAALFTQWVNDGEVSEGVGISSRVLGLAQERSLLERNARDTVGHHFAVVALEGDVLLGACSLDSIHPVHRTGLLGIMLGNKSCWNQGFGTDAVSLLVRYGFDQLNLNNIRLEVFDFNPAAVRCYEKCGFTEYGRLAESFFHAGAYHSTICMCILRKNFDSSK